MIKLIKYINKNTNLWLIFILTIIFSAAFLYLCNYDTKTLLIIRNYCYWWSLTLFLPYFLFAFECRNYSYENRTLKFRSICNVVQIPCFVITAISLAVLINPVSFAHSSSIFFFNASGDAIMDIFLTAVSYVLNYVINKKNKILIIKPKLQECKIILM